MQTFKSITIGNFTIPEFAIGRGELIQLVLPEINLGDYPLQLKQVLSQSTTFKLVDAEEVVQKNLLGFSHSIVKVLTRSQVQLGTRWQEYLHKEQISLHTRVSALPYGVRYILALEIALVKCDYLIIDLSGNDYKTLSQIKKILVEETTKGKSFLVLKENNSLLTDFNLGKELLVIEN
ncbi:MAG: hypothetical protein AAFY76_14360 [Cyanobacteria bacterium J06649_11]